MTFTTKSPYEIRKDGDMFFIIHIDTGWQSKKFLIEDIEVYRIGMTQDMSGVFKLTVITK